MREVNPIPTTFRIWKENEYGFVHLDDLSPPSTLILCYWYHCSNTHAQAYHLTTLFNKGCLKETLHILNITGNNVHNSHAYVSLLQGCIKRKSLPKENQSTLISIRRDSWQTQFQAMPLLVCMLSVGIWWILAQFLIKCLSEMYALGLSHSSSST